MEDSSQQGKRKLGKAERDVVALGIAIAAIILFVGAGGTLMPQILRAWTGNGETPDIMLTNAVLLNIALLICGWRRYADLQEEVKERRRAEENARQLAETDALTGCRNRRSGTPRIDALIAGARSSGREVALFMIDLDNFKQINDLNGHQAGDRVLTVVARRLRDALPAEGIVARIGGDEFVCAFTHPLDETEKVDQIAISVMKALSAPIECNRLYLEPTGSLGISSTCHQLTENEQPDGETLLHRADIAMYHAKKHGRDSHCWFEPQMEDELHFRNELESAIRRGVVQGEFAPFYEQQINLETGELTGFEMLARWKSPRYGLVSPDVFIPIAEEMDMISELSECLIRQALKDAKAWDPRLSLWVNISPLQLRDPWFAQRLLHLLIESGFPAQRLEIEITESCLHENIGAVRTIVSSLKNQGIRISLDDFGTGYSSLAQLRSLPFDRLKIDRSFVAEMSREGGSTDLVKANISLGKGLSLPVTAEGIEDSNALEALRALGDLKGQGYLYGQPEDAETTMKRLETMKLLSPAPVEEMREVSSSQGEEAPFPDTRKAG